MSARNSRAAKALRRQERADRRSELDARLDIRLAHDRIKKDIVSGEAERLMTEQGSLKAARIARETRRRLLSDPTAHLDWDRHVTMMEAEYIELARQHPSGDPQGPELRFIADRLLCPRGGPESPRQAAARQPSSPRKS